MKQINERINKLTKEMVTPATLCLQKGVVKLI